jgi:hypothetical protein
MEDRASARGRDHHCSASRISHSAVARAPCA